MLEDESIRSAKSMFAVLERMADELRAELIRLRRDVKETQSESRKARRELNAIELELAPARNKLKQLKRDAANLEQDLRSCRQQAEIREANEQLVLASIQANSLAETAIFNFEKILFSSQFDPLTNIPNRNLMLDRIKSAIAAAHRNDTRFALLFVDFDHFKQINDELGHAVGDAALQIVARRLEGSVRNTDTVSRHSGDEFLVLLTEIAHFSDAVSIAEKMLAAISEPACIADHVLNFSASIGIAIYPDDASDAISLTSLADAAMYRSKRRGGDTFQVYSQS